MGGGGGGGVFFSWFVRDHSRQQTTVPERRRETRRWVRHGALLDHRSTSTPPLPPPLTSYYTHVVSPSFMAPHEQSGRWAARGGAGRRVVVQCRPDLRIEAALGEEGEEEGALTACQASLCRRRAEQSWRGGAGRGSSAGAGALSD